MPCYAPTLSGMTPHRSPKLRSGLHLSGVPPMARSSALSATRHLGRLCRSYWLVCLSFPEKHTPRQEPRPRHPVCHVPTQVLLSGGDRLTPVAKVTPRSDDRSRPVSSWAVGTSSRPHL